MLRPYSSLDTSKEPAAPQGVGAFTFRAYNGKGVRRMELMSTIGVVFAIELVLGLGILLALPPSKKASGGKRHKAIVVELD